MTHARTVCHHCAQGGLGDVSIAEAHGPRLPELAALGAGLELVLIVWEAAQGTPLPAYVARYTHQLKRQLAAPSGLTVGSKGNPAELDGGGSGDSNGRDDICREADAAAIAKGDTPCDTAEEAPGQGVASAGPGAGDVLSGGDASPATGRRRFSGRADAIDAVDTVASADDELTSPLATAAPPAPARRAPRVLVVCNKCDAMPCPMPQIRGLPQAQAFIAVSAERGTNLAHLWAMVLPVLSNDVRARSTPAAQSPTRD